MADTLHKGLDGVLVAELGLSSIDGESGKLTYRGYSIEDLARDASYEEVLYLLWYGDLPSRGELTEFVDSMSSERTIDDAVLKTLAELSKANERPMAALRTGVSMLSATDPEADADLIERRREGRRIVAKIPTLLAAYDRLRHDKEVIGPREDLSYGANFLYMLTGEEPGEVAEETFDMALTLHADHGLNASTFTAMVISSTLADVYCALTGGVAALSGPLHGGANEEVMKILLEIDSSDSDAFEWIQKARDAGERIPGWGHRVYNTKDPRAVILQAKLEDLTEEDGETKWLDYLTTIEEYLTEEIGLPEKGIAPNVDYYSGAVYYKLGIPSDMYTPIFSMARASGWVGTILEYQNDNRLIRPRSRYDGPSERHFVPIDQR